VIEVVGAVLSVATLVLGIAATWCTRRQYDAALREQREFELTLRKEQREFELMLRKEQRGRELMLRKLETDRRRVSEQAGRRLELEQRLVVPEHVAQARRLRRRLAGAAAWRITDLATILAGRKRPGLRDEWRAHLAGEAGREMPASQRAAAALGFVAAAIRYRLQDVADLAWVPADAILKSRMLSNLVVWLPTAGGQ
jgi:hypothetical protein